MTEQDLFPFMETFRGLGRVFHLKGDDHEIKQTAASYFKALRRYPLPLVQAGAEVCLQRNRHFPKPAEWIDAVPNPAAQQAAALPAMSESEAHEWHRAEKFRYQDEPCRCTECRRAGVDHRPLRFVPEFTEHDTTRQVRDPFSNKTVVAGHWAHGEELDRWYAARQRFIEVCNGLGLKFGHLGVGALDDVKETGGRAALRRKGQLTKIITRVTEPGDLVEKANRIRQQAAAMIHKETA